MMQMPEFQMTVPDQHGTACELMVRWMGWEKRPLTIEITPADPTKGEGWTTVIDLTREDARLLRGALDLLLASPDISPDGEDAP